MKIIQNMVFGILLSLLYCFSVAAADKVVVIPLNSSNSQVKFLSIPFSAFQPYRNSQSYILDYNKGYAVSDGVASGNQLNLVAPVYLPHGAQLIEMILYTKDNSTTYQIKMYLFQHMVDQESYNLFGLVTSSGDSGYNSEKVTLDNYQINNELYSYTLLANITRDTTNDLWLKRVVISYR